MFSPKEERRQILNSGAFAVGGKLSNVKSSNVDGLGPQFAKKLQCCPDDFLNLDPSAIPLHVKNIMQLHDRPEEVLCNTSIFCFQHPICGAHVREGVKKEAKRGLTWS